MDFVQHTIAVEVYRFWQDRNGGERRVADPLNAA